MAREPFHIVDGDLYRAILHGVAAGACAVAARHDRRRYNYWRRTSIDQHRLAAARLSKVEARS